ncbi:MAG: peptide ABC transporter substrate-binding protein [Pseudomonadota bacterium]
MVVSAYYSAVERVRVLMFIVLVLSPMLIACNDGAETTGVAPDEPVKTLRRAVISAPATLDPHRVIDVHTDELLRDLNEGLITTRADGSLVAGLAESWEISDDGREYVFTLREDARWSNGDPITAEDFVFSFRRLVNPSTQGPLAAMMEPIGNANHIRKGIAPPDALAVRVQGEKQLAVTLKEPTAHFLEILAHTLAVPVHPDNVDRYDDALTAADTTALRVTGAYQLAAISPQRAVLTTNPHYYGADKLGYERVELNFIADHDQQLAWFINGDLDVTSHVPDRDYATLRREFKRELVVRPFYGVLTYAFDTTEPPFDNSAIRQAISMVVDREAITGDLLAGGNPPAWHFVSPGVNPAGNYFYEWRSWPRERQIEKAQALYAEAGYNANNPLQFDLHHIAVGEYEEIATAFAEMIETHLGAIVTAKAKPFEEVVQGWRNFAQWDMHRYGVGGTYNDANSILEVLQSDSYRNPAGWKSDDFDRLLREAASEQDPNRRATLLLDAEALMLQDYVMLPIYFMVTKRLVSSEVEGGEITVMNQLFSRHLSPRNANLR